MTKNPAKVIFFLENILTKLETFALSMAFLTLLMIAVVQVFLRKFFTAWFWADEFNQNLVVWVGLLGAVLAVKENRHLTTEVITNFLPKETRARPIISFLILIFVLVVTGTLAYVSWQFFDYRVTYEGEDQLLPGISKAYFSFIFPLAFGLMFLHYLIRLFELFYNLAGGAKAFPEDDGASALDISIKIKMS
jgi:TRAP-type C4-dicarboxylate transport system permease small subunit